MGKLLALAIVALASACSPPPAWQPGDGPLTFWTLDDVAWSEIERGCSAWEMTGLRCERVEYGRERVQVRIDPAAAYTRTTYRVQSDGTDLEWGYFVVLHEIDSGAKAAHEIGHLLGLWEHLDEGPAVMTSSPTSGEPTTADLDALALAWGDAPWETR